ncbi:hypothetical protein A3K55_01285 [Candidatus Shapirobacteria bacterium RBG_13_44_7]|uniref:Bacterial toxin RNase RnlA/LsoA DBD domain-containing protein n=1 Tax=Candidatus Shapirobacteria bacterium RBG_13_44_7 TaxID=1802149 RepID=A0A1F7SKF5_9BACT|nr:MAG: hypothetical protein A3K55_01285 [Candidatus Shapirobacteria bacterium RBG_13_44_7]
MIPATLFSQVKSKLPPEQSGLIADIQTILGCLKKFDHISDYSFLVSPVAKAYEGFLKDFFLKTGIIDSDTYHSDRFRVGKTLNPSLRYKRYSIFQKLADLSDGGEELAEILWDAWKFGRNEIFHYFPKNLHKLSRDEAEGRIAQVLQAIIAAQNFYQSHLAVNKNLL